jgi:DNA-binding transcriptional ArsR family regulator
MANDRCDVLCLDLPRAEELRRRRLPAAEAGAAASRARALADATRLSLTASLRDGGELCVCDLAWISGRSQNLVSHHLRALKHEGLADSRRAGKIVFYSLTDAGSELLDAVLGAADAAPAGLVVGR